MNTHRGDDDLDGVDGTDLANALPRPVGFVMGGGAGLGAVQVGMLQALYRFGIQPDAVVGTSAGALNGAVLAGRPADGPARLADIWGELERRDVFPGNLLTVVWRLTQSGTHISSSEGVEHVVARAVSAETFEDLTIPFAAVALDLGTGEVRVLDHGPLVPALLASAAIPGAFPPVTLDGRVLVDGGTVAQVPIRQAWERGARSVVVLDCTVPTPGDSYETMSDILSRVSTIQQRIQLESALPDVAADVPVLYLDAPPARHVSAFDFDQTAALIEDSERAAVAQLRGLSLAGPGLYGEPYERYAPWDA
jgi:NTE family protein